MTIILAILVFSLLVIAHEFGHMIVAKKVGVYVEEFAVGMGPKLVSKKFGETLYSIRLFPIGGFCKMYGEDESIRDPRAFNSQKPFQRFLILAAGSFMNFILAFVILFVMSLIGNNPIPVVKELSGNESAIVAGLQKGDIITKVGNMDIHVYEDIKLALFDTKEKPVEVTVKRAVEGSNTYETKQFTITPANTKEAGYIIGFKPDYQLGILTRLFEKDIDSDYQTANIFQMTEQSFWRMCYYIKSAYYGIVKLATREIATDQMTGPIGIVNTIGDVYEKGAQVNILSAILNVMSLAALLSANLGALNLLPIPALDGGRIFFLLIEAIRRKPISPEKEGMIHFAGFALLMLFMIFIAYNDVLRIVS